MCWNKTRFLVCYMSLKWFLSRSFCSVLFCSVLSTIGGQMADSIGLKIGTNTHWIYAMKIGGSAIRIDARTARANVCAAPHIQHRRPSGWTDRAPHWYKHSLGQWTQVMVVGDREGALMCAQRAQTCAHHYTSSIGGQTDGPIGAQICTNTHWNNGQQLWGSAVASAH
jgi:hypothetical protein